MPRLVLGSRNKKKLRELIELLSDLVEVTDLSPYANAPADIEETGTTFEENARLKATTLAPLLGEWVLGEDSGLVVPALAGQRQRLHAITNVRIQGGEVCIVRTRGSPHDRDGAGIRGAVEGMNVRPFRMVPNIVRVLGIGTHLDLIERLYDEADPIPVQAIGVFDVHVEHEEPFVLKVHTAGLERDHLFVRIGKRRRQGQSEGYAQCVRPYEGSSLRWWEGLDSVTNGRQEESQT